MDIVMYSWKKFMCLNIYSWHLISHISCNIHNSCNIQNILNKIEMIWFLLLRLLLWIHMKRVSWPPAWWTTVSTLWRSASVELYPAPTLTASVPWSIMPTLCWSLTSGAHFHFSYSALYYFMKAIPERHYVFIWTWYLGNTLREFHQA